MSGSERLFFLRLQSVRVRVCVCVSAQGAGQCNSLLLQHMVQVTASPAATASPDSAASVTIADQFGSPQHAAPPPSYALSSGAMAAVGSPEQDAVGLLSDGDEAARASTCFLV